jgi:predicted AlkP superfamily phosphohydrolase/phosphomutase
LYTNAFGKARRLVLLAVDACDPRLLRKYIGEGELPNIAALVSRGTFANMLSVPLPR